MSSTSVGQGIESGADAAWQTFFVALRQAVASPVPLQERLATLVLGVCQLRQEHFPDTDTWWRFEEILKATSGRVGKVTPAKILAVTSKMTDQDATKWLQEAVQIFSNLSEESEL
jgi:hypothetical protein